MIKLVQINIEREKHVDLVVPFLKAEMPDVVCAQELCAPNVEAIELALGATCHFTPMLYFNGVVEGLGIFTRLPVVDGGFQYYSGDGVMKEFDTTTTETKIATESFAVHWCDVQKGDDVLRIATTHFIWTPDGSASEHQRTALVSMRKVLDGLGDFVLTGDFNAPRGGEIFTELATHYKDNVPPEYTTSIDGNIHRAGDLQLMVDGVFSTPKYVVSDVVMRCGVSDHCALIANVTKLS